MSLDIHQILEKLPKGTTVSYSKADYKYKGVVPRSWTFKLKERGAEVSVAKNADCGEETYEVLPFLGDRSISSLRGVSFPQYLREEEIASLIL